MVYFWEPLIEYHLRMRILHVADIWRCEVMHPEWPVCSGSAVIRGQWAVETRAEEQGHSATKHCTIGTKADTFSVPSHSIQKKNINADVIWFSAVTEGPQTQKDKTTILASKMNIYFDPLGFL